LFFLQKIDCFPVLPAQVRENSLYSCGFAAYFIQTFVAHSTFLHKNK
jgi:hypothetical protein